MKSTQFFFIVSMLVIASSCNNADKGNNQVTRTTFFDKSGMDTTIKPGDNFFLYANGSWIKATKIPDDQSGWGSFYNLYEENLQKMKGILEDAAGKNAAKGTAVQKVGDYYTSGMDTVTIDSKGYEPLKPLLSRIDAVKDYKQLINVIAESYPEGEGYLFGFFVGADEKNSVKNIASFYQTGLTLPEKDYYTRPQNEEERLKMIAFATKLFILSGEDSANASKKALQVINLEKLIAASHRSPEELRDPQTNYNKMSVGQLSKMSPNIDWNNAFVKMHIVADSVNVGQPAYFATLSQLLASQPIEVWKAKIRFDILASNAPYLSKDFRDASFNFNKTFSGQKVQSERWKIMVSNTDGGLKDLASQLFVEKYFTPQAKKRMDEMVNNLLASFQMHIQELDWMSDSTKQRALSKLKSIIRKIGYPEKWKNFDDVIISKNDFYGNNVSIARHNYKEMVGKLGKPVDKTEWGMTPFTVNAYYNPSFNEIVFPAGILQFPFFDMNADDAINYGGIGMVIGHEITHGFDDQGRQYDADGNMRDWWTKSDAEKFTAKSNSVVNQYNEYTILDSLHLNGKLTLGENLADLGGIAIAYDAFKMTDQAKGGALIDGFTPDQRFFLGFAQIWRIKNREETMKVRVSTDSHSPEMYRINGPLTNFEPFYKAFSIKEGDKMYKPENMRAKIW